MMPGYVFLLHLLLFCGLLCLPIIHECHIPHTIVHFYIPFDIYIYDFRTPERTCTSWSLLSVKMFSVYLVHRLFRLKFLGFYSIVIEVAILLGCGAATLRDWCIMFWDSGGLTFKFWNYHVYLYILFYCEVLCPSSLFICAIFFPHHLYVFIYLVTYCRLRDHTG